MLKTEDLKRKGDWTGPASDTVVLSYDDRYRRRMTMTGENGTKFLFEMDQAVVLCDGDALVLSNGETVLVQAADEPLLAISGKDSEHLVRLAWHLGNRHLACQIDGLQLHIRHDHVIAAMLEGLGATVTEVSRPFQPEGGAYARGGDGHGHDDHHHEHSNTGHGHG